MTHTDVATAPQPVRQLMHRQYLTGSPFYLSLVRTYGRWLPESVAASIFTEHGASLPESETEVNWRDGKVSALDTVMFLGY